jgi:hypothetical protein
MMKVKLVLLGTIAAVMSGCGRSPRIAGGPEPAPTANPPSMVSSSRTTWTITPTTQEYRYRSSAGTLLELSDSAGTTGDSIDSTVDYTLSVTRSPETLSYSVTVESMSVQGGQRTGSVARQLPFSFTGHLQHGKLTINAPAVQSAIDCSNEALSTATAIQRTVVPVPLFVQKDMTWMDSTTASVCSGLIPVTSTALRRYRVMGETDKGILIERQDRTVSAGEGTQGQHRVRLRSDGTGTAQLIVDSRTGSLIESTGTYVTSVVVTASRRERKFTQTTRERISLR